MEYATLLEDIKNAAADDEDGDDDEGPDDGDEGDEGGWEDEGKAKTKSPFVYSELLSDIIDCGTGFGMGDDGDGEDDEQENESDRAHPLYAVDLKASLEAIFRSLAANPGVQARVAGHLTPAEQKSLAAAFE